MDLNFIRSYCVARFNYILQSLTQNCPIALYGAGRHSVFLEGILPLPIKERILFYVDDDEMKKSLFGRTVFRPKDAPWEKIGALVVSSDLRQEELYSKASAQFAGRVERLYLGLPMRELVAAKKCRGKIETDFSLRFFQLFVQQHAKKRNQLAAAL